MSITLTITGETGFLAAQHLREFLSVIGEARTRPQLASPASGDESAVEVQTSEGGAVSAAVPTEETKRTRGRPRKAPTETVPVANEPAETTETAEASKEAKAETPADPFDDDQVKVEVVPIDPEAGWTVQDVYAAARKLIEGLSDEEGRKKLYALLQRFGVEKVKDFPVADTAKVVEFVTAARAG